MINREVTYERNLLGSFIKIPTAYQGAFDEKIMLMHPIAGMIPVEKCFYNDEGRYWYNITGFQPLDTKCRMQNPDSDFVEKLILRICEQLEELELNLIAPETLLMDPEYIFISNHTDEIRFMMYPGIGGDVMDHLRELMEYLLTKVNHIDGNDTEHIYHLYSLILSHSCSVGDIRLEIEKMRQAKLIEEMQQDLQMQPEEAKAEPDRPKRGKLKVVHNWYVQIVDKLRKVTPKLWKKTLRKGAPEQNANAKKPADDVWVKEMNLIEEEPEKLYGEPECYPTICILQESAKVQGILKPQSDAGRADIYIEEDEVRIGKGANVDIRISDEAVSRIHAKITRESENYYLEDLNSTNGTFLNEELLCFREKYRLKKDDIIQFANVKYRFL